ncbi:MAG TPA: hypothetical protein VMD08_03525 [Candidatus Baltobacteraceae bacterium]|nr:hypothetical protein [Candidatus Baltobacteraceae bacterium]
MTARHVVVIAGGAVAGSEVAAQLARHGVCCIVVEQNERPYGKIEDGLPRWHVNLRRQEARKIDAKLAHPSVHYVPHTRLGRDLLLSDVLGWGVSAVVLAVGAWRDRALPLPGIEAYVGRGLYYQNPLVYWFNHASEPDYHGPAVTLADGALVVGGGLASLDVVKILMLETVAHAVHSHGHKVDLYDMERRGIGTTLEQLDLSLRVLGLRGCTLICRRPIEDLPLATLPPDSTPEQAAKTRATRRKLLQNFQTKYLFRVREQTLPVGYLTGQERLTGLRLAPVKMGEAMSVPGREVDQPTPLVISSIGSVPEPLEGVPMQGPLYRIRHPATGEVDGVDGVFGVGNAVTGRGNILVSLKHGRLVSQHMLEGYLVGAASGYEETFGEAEAAARTRVSAIVERLRGRLPLPATRVAEILAHVRVLQDRAGYPGDYAAWVDRMYPAA